MWLVRNLSPLLIVELVRNLFPPPVLGRDLVPPLVLGRIINLVVCNSQDLNLLLSQGLGYFSSCSLRVRNFFPPLVLDKNLPLLVLDRILLPLLVLEETLFPLLEEV